MEVCLAEMELVNAHLQRTANEIIEKILEEGRATTREKAQERMRAQLAPQQKKLTDVRPAKISKKKGEREKGEYKAEGAEDVYFAVKEGKGSVQHLGEAKDAEQLIDEAEEYEDELAYDKYRDAQDRAHEGGEQPGREN